MDGWHVGRAALRPIPRLILSTKQQHANYLGTSKEKKEQQDGLHLSVEGDNEPEYAVDSPLICRKTTL